MDPTKNLILMVKDRPAIWDKTCEDYRDKAAKDRAWVEIYRQMEPSYDSLQHMMKNQIGNHKYFIQIVFLTALKPIGFKELV